MISRYNLTILIASSWLIACLGSPSGLDCPSSETPCGSEIAHNVTQYVIATNRIIEVYTPPNYDPETEYPVLLLNDGESMFGQSSWELNKILDDLIATKKIEPIIAVAVYVHANRNNWYIPYDDGWITSNWGPYVPKAEEYADYIFDQVLPFVKENFKVNTERTGMMGASLGGLISTWMGIKYPDQIQYSAGLSGSLWVDDYAIFDEVTSPFEDGQKFWFDIGAVTGEWNYYVPLLRALDDAGATPGVQSFYYEDPEGRHAAYYWVRRIHFPLIAFYGIDQNPDPVSMEVVLECINSSSNPGLKFRRMNPIIKLSNDLKYSLAHTASYTLLSETGELGTEGSFKNDPDYQMKVMVEFENFSKEVVIPAGYCR